MKVNQVSTLKFSANSQNNSKRNYVSITGYAAAACGVASGILGVNKKIKLHRYFAYAAGFLTALHIGIVETNNYQYRKNSFTA